MTPYLFFSGIQDIKNGSIRWNEIYGFGEFKSLRIRLMFQSLRTTVWLSTINPDGSWYSFSFGHNSNDGAVRTVFVKFQTAGRYLTNVSTKMSYNSGAATELGTGYIYIEEIVAYKY